MIDGTERAFGPSPGTQLPAWKSIAIGDLAGDGPDIITAEGDCGCIESPPGTAAGRVSVLPGNTAEGVDPNVVPVTTQSVPGVLSIAVGDIDGDGRQDVVGTSHTKDSDDLFVHVGDGSGGLAAPVTVAMGGDTYSRAPIQLADFDRNGSLDPVVITSEIKILMNGSTAVVPPVTLKPLAGISGIGKSAALNKKGFVALGTAKNPPTSSVDLSITIPGGKGKGRTVSGDPLRAKASVIGHAKITVPAGGEAALEVRLKSKARKKLKNGALKAKLTLVATATDGTEETETQKLKIKPPKKK
jgi:VCBS repeat protein